MTRYKMADRDQLNLAVVGLGYWGPNYVRVLSEIERVTLKYCCDLDESKFDKLRRFLSNVKTTTDYKEILEDEEVDAVVITTPPNTHYRIIKDCLKHQKHVLVEKPMTDNLENAKEVVNLANKVGKVLMVGHIYLYNPGILKLKNMLETGEMGRVFYGIALRLGLGPIRKFASALWDLAIHDIYISMYLFKSKPISVLCVGESYLQDDIEDYVNLTLKYPNKINFSIYASWFCPEKARKITLVGSEKMVTFDDTNKTEMIKIFEKSLNLALLNSTPKYVDHQMIVRQGDTKIPYIEQSEPLRNQIEHFIECIKTGKTPRSCREQGLTVIEVLEAAEKSLKSGEGIVCQ